MKTIEYRDTVDKAGWPRGAWDSEPDKIQWQDEATGLPCLIVRNHMGALCGYVGVDQNHPFYRKHYSGERQPDKNEWARDWNNSPSSAVSVHGGLTYSDFCDEGEECQSICHKVEAGENDKVWWFGFDCGHCRDRVPEMHKYMREWDKHATYRDVAYVKAECTSLAKQLMDIQNGKHPNPETGH